MKNLMKLPLVIAFLFCITSLFSCEKDDEEVMNTQTTTSTDEAKSKKEIEQIFTAYELGLKNADAQACTDLYTSDGVFMPSNAPTAEGTTQIKGSYEYVFSQIIPDIKFDNIVIEVSGSVAYATSTSEGTSKIVATGESVPEVNRELFVFEMENDTWKISKYMFNKTE